jgi:S-adenosylmethionine synthetase
MNKYLFTSESVTEGHPDKLCDQISDAILDAILAQDPYGRVACETFCTTGQINVMGEISASCYVDIPKIVRVVLNDIGYSSPEQGFDGNTCAINTSIDEQSSDIAIGVNHSQENKTGSTMEEDLNGAGDQGIMFGYACDETPELMPLPVSLAHKLAKQLAEVRKSGELLYLRPDGKTQVTVEYEDGIPKRIDTIIVSAQHQPDVEMNILHKGILQKVIMPIISSDMMDANTKIHINPTGRFVIGGPQGDTGLTGRKIIVDTYGGYARHGGGAFSGKDPTKVDRSATYAARYVAKNIVSAGLAKQCEIQIAYSIGIANPVSIMVDTFGTGKYPDVEIAIAVQKLFDLRPTAIIKKLDLRKPIYKKLAVYGHMGREDLNATWEKKDIVNEFKKYFNEI